MNPQNTQAVAGVGTAVLLAAWNQGAPDLVLWLVFWLVVVYTAKEMVITVSKHIWGDDV